MWKFIIHIPTITGSFSLVVSSAAVIKRTILTKTEKRRSCPSRHPINTYKCPRRKKQYLSFIYAHSRPNKSPFNFNCVVTDSVMGHERRHISSFPFFQHQFPPPEDHLIAYSNFIYFYWNEGEKRRKLWITENKNPNFMFLLMKIIWKKTKKKTNEIWSFLLIVYGERRLKLPCMDSGELCH